MSLYELASGLVAFRTRKLAAERALAQNASVGRQTIPPPRAHKALYETAYSAARVDGRDMVTAARVFGTNYGPYPRVASNRSNRARASTTRIAHAHRARASSSSLSPRLLPFLLSLTAISSQLSLQSYLFS